MFKRKKLARKKTIIFDYHSLNPFAESNSAGEINLNGKKENRIIDENEWRIEYEMIYRSYQLDR